jgi:signal transduction histidine kinase
MLKLVVRNLVNNAVKFTQTGGEISIGSSIESDRVNLIVEDNGIGISEEKQKTLFSLETQSTYGTNKEKGVGLGLLLCKDFTEMQGGEISFESMPGKGTSFTLSFPSTETINPSTIYTSKPSNSLQ